MEPDRKIMVIIKVEMFHYCQQEAATLVKEAESTFYDYDQSGEVSDLRLSTRR
jgi:hypothetical protein